MKKSITKKQKLEELKQVIWADYKIHPEEDKLLAVFTEMLCSKELPEKLKAHSQNPDVRDKMYRFIHLDNILSVALVDNEFHELEMEKCYQLAVNMGFEKMAMKHLLDKIKVAFGQNKSKEHISNLIKSEICVLINQTQFQPD